MVNEIWIERMTWQEVEQAIEEGFKTVLLIAGSIEQHGPHLPTGTDTMLGYALADSIAKKMGSTLVAPVIRPGLSEHHMKFKGSLTLTKATFQATVSEVVHSLARHGFERIAITFSHGGNANALKELMPKLAKELPDTEILTITDMAAFTKPFASISQEAGLTPEQVGVHAGEFETSVMLAWDENAVRMDKLEQGFLADFEKEGEKLSKALEEGLHTLTSIGVLGDATPADKQRGQKYQDAVATYMAAHFEKVQPA